MCSAWGWGDGRGYSLAESTAFVSISAPQRCNFIWHKVTVLALVAHEEQKISAGGLIEFLRNATDAMIAFIFFLSFTKKTKKQQPGHSFSQKSNKVFRWGQIGIKGTSVSQ